MQTKQIAAKINPSGGSTPDNRPKRALEDGLGKTLQTEQTFLFCGYIIQVRLLRYIFGCFLIITTKSK